jgi:hypothetical protein
MPSAYKEHVRKWLELAEIDYIGPFVKAWLAFNAWYRSVYSHRTDRAILDDFRWQPNVVRNKLVPLLTDRPAGRGDQAFRPSEEAEQFRAHIGDLHHRLERYHVHSGHGGEWERITFTNVFLRARAVTQQTQRRNGWTYTVSPGTGNPTPLVVAVHRRNGSPALNVNQARFDIGELQVEPAFQGLSSDQQGTLLSVYRLMNPRLVVDLTSNGGTTVRCGAYDFGCAADDLFAGLCEVLYSMRCSLFHGELVPDPEAVACYEPAYRILRRFLSSIG